MKYSLQACWHARSWNTNKLLIMQGKQSKQRKIFKCSMPTNSSGGNVVKIWISDSIWKHRATCFNLLYLKTRAFHVIDTTVKNPILCRFYRAAGLETVAHRTSLRLANRSYTAVSDCTSNEQRWSSHMDVQRSTGCSDGNDEIRLLRLYTARFWPGAGVVKVTSCDGGV